MTGIISCIASPELPVSAGVEVVSGVDVGVVFEIDEGLGEELVSTLGVRADVGVEIGFELSITRPGTILSKILASFTANAIQENLISFVAVLLIAIVKPF